MAKKRKGLRLQSVPRNLAESTSDLKKEIAESGFERSEVWA
jgi:hypothetical protein